MNGVSRRGLFGVAAAGAALAAVPGRAAREKPVFGPPPGVAQLSRNENPYGPSPAALRAMADAASAGCYYSNGAEERLAAMIAERHGLSPAHVMIGAGSTEVLNCATIALAREGEIVAPELLFEPPLAYAERKGAVVRRVPLRPDMHMDLAALLSAITPETRLVHLCNPNNPTGLVLPGDTIRAFLSRVPAHVTVLVDEAYNELTPAPESFSVVDRVAAGDNLIVTRTFSKLHGLAGLRVGYAMARPDLLDTIAGWSMSNGGNAAGLAAAIATYDDRPFLSFSKARIEEARSLIVEAASALGLETLPSACNFVTVKVPDANRLHAALKAQGIDIRPAYGKWTRWSRVSCGRIEDVKRYAAALPRALAA
ncbi:MAG: histidinol-phosphate transaminase [Sphingomonadaceae bacterium]